MTATYAAVLIPSPLSGVTTAFGVLVATLIREDINAIAVGIGFSACAMLFVSLHELVPKARRHGRIGWFVAGPVLGSVV